MTILATPRNTPKNSACGASPAYLNAGKADAGGCVRVLHTYFGTLVHGYLVCLEWSNKRATTIRGQGGGGRERLSKCRFGFCTPRMRSSKVQNHNPVVLERKCRHCYMYSKLPWCVVFLPPPFIYQWRFLAQAQCVIFYITIGLGQHHQMNRLYQGTRDMVLVSSGSRMHDALGLPLDERFKPSKAELPFTVWIKANHQTCNPPWVYPGQKRYRYLLCMSGGGGLLKKYKRPVRFRGRF